MHGNYGWQWTFHNLPFLVSSFGEGVVKRWCETSQTLLAFGQSPWKLWCSGWEQKPTPLIHLLSQQQGKMDPLGGPDGPTPSRVVTEPPQSSFTQPRAAGGETQAPGSSHVLHSILSSGQAQQAERRTQLQSALWTSLLPRGLHQDLHIIWTPVFSWLILYLLPETVFLGSWIKSHSAPAN